MRKVITLEQAMKGRPIAEPLTVYDCSLISDGAAAVVIVSLRNAPRDFTDQAGAGCWASRRLPITWRSIRRPTSRRSRRCAAAAQKAYKMAGVTRARHPIRRTARLLHHRRDHRAWKISGFVRARARAARSLRLAAHGAHGAMPINTSGGLKSKGHPVGATGVAQICDLVQQIRGEAGERQLARHSLGLAQNLGGSARPAW